MSKTQFTQCKLVRQDGNARTETISWIPTKVKSDAGMVKLRVDMVVKRRRGQMDPKLDR